MFFVQKSGWPSRTRTSSALLRCFTLLILITALAACDYFASADSRLERASASMEAGNYPQAMSQLKTSLERDPGHVPSRLLLARLSLWLGDAAGAEKELERATAAGAADVLVRPLRYQALYIRGQFKQLLELLQSDHETPAGKRAILRSRAQIAIGRYEDAERSAQEAVTALPEDSAALLQYARALAARGDLTRSMAIAQRINQPDGVHAQALALRGAIAMTQGKYAEARDFFTQASAMSGKELSVPEQLLIQVSLTEAQLALQDAQAAAKTLATVAKWAPNAVVTYYLRARVAMLRNEYTAVVAECQRALNLDPSHVPSQLMLAAAHLGHGSVEQAEEVLEQLLGAYPDNTAARKLLVQVYLARKRTEEARRILASLPEAARADTQVEWLMGAALTQAGESAAGLEYLERSSSARPGDYPRRIDLAAAYLAAGNSDKALEILRSLPSGAAQSQRARKLLVAANIAGKSPADARSEIERLVAAADTDAELLAMAAAYLLSSGESRRARELLDRAVARDPKAIIPRMLLATLAQRDGDLNAARQLWLEILKLDPGYQPAYIDLAKLSLRSADRTQARKWLEQAIGADPAAIEARFGLARMALDDKDLPRGRDLLNQAIDVSRHRPDVLVAAGSVLAQVGLYEEALTRFTEAGAAGSPEGVLNEARTHYELGRLEPARQAAQKALGLRPDWLEAQRLLVQLDVREGNVDGAISRARTTAGPDATPSARAEIEGDVQMAAKRYGAAEASYESAQRERPSGALAIKIFRARLEGGVTSAEVSLLSWLERAPEDAAVRRILADYYQSAGQAKRAVSEYERLLKARPRDTAVLNNLAWLLHEAGDSRALDLAGRAYELAPGAPEISDTYGWILVQTGEFQKGLAVLERALAAAPSNHEIGYHVAVARARSGNRAGAVKLLDELLASPQSFLLRADAEELLRSLKSERS